MIRVTRTVADRLKAAPMTLKFRGHDARIRAADKLLTEAMDQKGVPTFESEDAPAAIN